MTTAGTAGEIAGGFAGGALGGAIGSFFFPPAGTMAGRWLGSRLGRAAGRAAAEALASAMENANEEAAAEEDTAEDSTEECATCRSQECKDLEADINRRMYDSKRAPGPGGRPQGGYHGQFPRRAEQICGANGPGTPSWNEHDSILKRQQTELRRLYDKYMQAGCMGHPEENINWGDYQWATNPGFVPTPRQHLGPGHPACQTAADMIRQNRARDLNDQLQRELRPPTPPPGPPVS